MLSSREKTCLFAHKLADEFHKNFEAASEQQMIRTTSDRLRNKRWLLDARCIQKHMDLHLVGLLEDARTDINIVLQFLWEPKSLHRIVLAKLIARQIPYGFQQYGP